MVDPKEIALRVVSGARHLATVSENAAECCSDPEVPVTMIQEVLG